MVNLASLQNTKIITYYMLLSSERPETDVYVLFIKNASSERSLAIES